MRDSGTFATVPSDAWERYPSPNTADANGRNRPALPNRSEFLDHRFDVVSKCGNRSRRSRHKIDAFRAIVKFAFVNGQPRGLGKRFRQTIFIKEIFQIIFHAFGKRILARFVPSQS